MGFNPIRQHVPCCIIAGQAAVDIFPQRRFGYVQARQIVDAQLFPAIHCQICPLAVPGFILQLETALIQRGAGRVVVIHPVNREGVCEVLHVVFGGDRHIDAFLNGPHGHTGLRFRLRPLFGHRIGRIQLVSRNRRLHDLELDAHRNLDLGGLDIRRLHGSGDAGLGHCL